MSFLQFTKEEENQCACFGVTWPTTRPTTQSAPSPRIETEERAGALLVYQKMALVVQTGSHWGIPKGAPNSAEPVQDNILRQIREQTSLEVSCQRCNMFNSQNTTFVIKSLSDPPVIDINAVRRSQCNSGVAMVNIDCLRTKKHEIDLDSVSTSIISSIQM